jgi:hypothetical protein
MAEKAAKSVEELNREILETQLETSKINLVQAKEANAAFQQKRETSRRINANRQHQFDHDARNLRSIQEHCQHMAGGDAGGDILEGGGKFAFSTISCTIMPDNATKLLQCPRCRLMLYGRDRTPQEEVKMEAAAAKGDKKAVAAWKDHLWFKELYQLFRKEGLGKKSVMRGPTFDFTRDDGTRVIPDVTGYATSGAGGR